jgi:hypothetical protein
MKMPNQLPVKKQDGIWKESTKSNDEQIRSYVRQNHYELRHQQLLQ